MTCRPLTPCQCPSCPSLDTHDPAHTVKKSLFPRPGSGLESPPAAPTPQLPARAPGLRAAALSLPLPAGCQVSKSSPRGRGKRTEHRGPFPSACPAQSPPPASSPRPLGVAQTSGLSRHHTDSCAPPWRFLHSTDCGGGLFHGNNLLIQKLVPRSELLP